MEFLANMSPETIMRYALVSVGCVGLVIGLSNTLIGAIGGAVSFALPRFKSLPFVSSSLHIMLWQKVGLAFTIGCLTGSGIRELVRFFNDLKLPKSSI